MGKWVGGWIKERRRTAPQQAFALLCMVDAGAFILPVQVANLLRTHPCPHSREVLVGANVLAQLGHVAVWVGGLMGSSSPISPQKTTHPPTHPPTLHTTHAWQNRWISASLLFIGLKSAPPTAAPISHPVKALVNTRAKAIDLIRPAFTSCRG